MPELPEVEVLRRSLAPVLVGQRIEDVVVHQPALREPVNVRSLGIRARGQVQALRRRSKYLLIDVESARSSAVAKPGSTIVVHLGMSGRLHLVAGSAPRELHEHVAFRLDSGSRLRFEDPRRFGLVFARPTRTLERDRHFLHLGVEPLGGELDGALLKRLAEGRRAPVKQFLMDARRVVGVGNIYASESLFRAGIHPRRSVARIGLERWQRLASAVETVLRQAIEEGGTTLNDFEDGLGQSGYFQVSLSVYGREGEPCQGCGGAVRRFVQAGRSTYYCPSCQH